LRTEDIGQRGLIEQAMQNMKVVHHGRAIGEVGEQVEDDFDGKSRKCYL